MADSKRETAEAIDQGRLLNAAFELLADEGYEGLSTRVLGRRLGVNASALYRHVAGRAELVESMAAAIYDDALSGVPAGLTWDRWITAFGEKLRRVMLGRRGSAQLCAGVRGSDAATWDATFRIPDPLVVGGLAEERAFTLVSTTMSLVLGWVSYEQNGQLRRSLSRLIDFDAAFTHGLKALVRGFACDKEIA